MTQPDTRALQVLLEREEAARDQAAAELGRAREQQRQAEARSGMLDDYRRDYVARWSGQFQREASTPQLLQHYHSFMSRLDDALAQQRLFVGRSQAAVQRCRAVLVQAETRVAAVRKLIERRVAEHERQQNRREQKLNDEFAQRVGWLNSRTDTVFSRD